MLQLRKFVGLQLAAHGNAPQRITPRMEPARAARSERPGSDVTQYRGPNHFYRLPSGGHAGPRHDAGCTSRDGRYFLPRLNRLASRGFRLAAHGSGDPVPPSPSRRSRRRTALDVGAAGNEHIRSAHPMLVWTRLQATRGRRSAVPRRPHFYPRPSLTKVSKTNWAQVLPRDNPINGSGRSSCSIPSPVSTRVVRCTRQAGFPPPAPGMRH